MVGQVGIVKRAVGLGECVHNVLRTEALHFVFGTLEEAKTNVGL